MKEKFKFTALLVGSVMAVAMLAGCGGTGNPPDENPPDVGGATAPAFTDQEVTLDLRTSVSNPIRISDSLFGVFLEDINYAGYLLDDNLLLNGSFETFNGNKTLGWTASGASVAVANSDGLLKGTAYAGRGVNDHYLEVTATAGGSISNKGPDALPIAVKEGGEYLFSAFVKTANAADMTVKVKDGSADYLQATVSLKAGDWVKYETRFTSSGTAAEGLSFEIFFGGAGTYLLDGVSLETLDATVGIKQYVYDAIEELSPKFVRFPGGCIIEGDSAGGGADCTEVYDWKNSVGAVQNGDNAGDDDIPAFEYTLVRDGAESTAETYGEWVTRKQNGDLWGYDMEYGVGFYEYFLLCDRLGASALPVLNCGLSDQGGAAQGSAIPLNGRHGKKVDDYIRDAVDLIEFSKGDASTKWGALRAAMGHEEPFEMDYIGIGNEQFGAYYTEYYEKFLQSPLFQQAMKDYSVKPIVGNGMHLEDCQNPDRSDNRGTAQTAARSARSKGVVDAVADYGLHDQHYYVNWTELLENHTMYDGYLRSYEDPDEYYEVFVGEYSANEGESRAAGYPLYANSLQTALSEAAMMTGFERNGDIVKLAAYAPMFGAANRRKNPAVGGDDNVNQWDVDMMYYTNTQIVRTANYYVQQMFMQNLGDIVLNVSSLKWAGGAKQTVVLPADNTYSESKEVDKLYFVASKTDEGDVIVKIVNISSSPVKCNVSIGGGESKGAAKVTELYGGMLDTNVLGGETVKPVTSDISWTGSVFGCELKACSLTVIRIPMK